MNRWQIRRVCTVWFCVVCCLTASSVCSAVTFVNVAVEAGVDFRYTHGGTGQKFFIETMGPGCAFLDYDGDGGLDIYAVNGHSLKEGAQAQETNHLFRNKGNGTFADVSVAAGVDDRGYGVGVTAADYDNDGDADLFVSNYGPNVLYANSADGSFRDHTALAGVGDSSWGTGCTFLDVDNDGLLDPNYFSRSILLDKTDAFDRFNKGESRTITEGDLRTIDLDKGVVDVHPRKR